MIERFRRKAMPAGELLAALRHADGCRDCASRIAPPEAGVLIAGTDVRHLDPEGELFDYVDRLLGPAEVEVVESHLEDCAMCRAEVADLRGLRRPPSRTMKWVTLATAASLIVVVGISLFAPSQRVSAPPTPVRPGVAAPHPVADSAASPTPAPTLYESKRWETLVTTAVEQKRLPLAPILASLNPPPDVLRGESSRAAQDVTPRGIVTEETRPRFAWAPHPDSTYLVSVFDRETVEVARSEGLSVPEWRPDKPLRRGVTYVWQVEVTSSGRSWIQPAPPSPPAMFHVLGAGAHQDIERARTLHPDDHLLHAVLYAAAGMETESAAALRKAARGGEAGAAKILAGTARRF
jgi:hypothetical protein